MCIRDRTIAVHMGKNLLYTKFAEDMVIYILFGGGTFPTISGFIKYKIDLEKNMEYQWDTVTEDCLLYTSWFPWRMRHFAWY